MKAKNIKAIIVIGLSYFFLNHHLSTDKPDNQKQLQLSVALLDKDDQTVSTISRQGSKKNELKTERVSTLKVNRSNKRIKESKEVSSNRENKIKMRKKDQLKQVNEKLTQFSYVDLINSEEATERQKAQIQSLLLEKEKLKRALLEVELLEIKRRNSI